MMCCVQQHGLKVRFLWLAVISPSVECRHGVCSLAFVCKTLRVRQWGVGLEPYAGVTDMVSSEHEVISTLAYIFSGVCLLGIIIHPHMHCDQQKN